MSWVSLALGLLSIANQLLAMATKKQQLQEAQERQVAVQAIKILEMTKLGQELRVKLAALNDSETEELWNRMVRDA